VSLGKYLDGKRDGFSRLYFLGDGEFIALLSTSDATVLSNIVVKMFTRMRNLNAQTVADSLSDPEQRKKYPFSYFRDNFPLIREIQLMGGMDLWLPRIVDSMKI
jgi:hypothetical protein